MKCALILTLAGLVATGCAAPFNLNDIFPGFVGESTPDQQQVKRQVQANPDAELKQISLNSLIGNLENSLFESALSVHGASAPDSVVSEVRPGQSVDKEQHTIAKRHDEPKAVVTPVVNSDIILQTTTKVPESEEGGPAHLLIDRVSVQPHNGGVPLLPTFQVHHTKVVSATIKEDSNNDNSDGKQTKISITKTSITSTVEGPEGQSSSTALPDESSSSSTAKSTAAGISSSSSSSTTEQSIAKLKKVEQQLKEKVAEVEADPVILSSRV